MLLVDTNFSAAPLQSALCELGHEVYLCGGNPNDSLARNAERYHAVNYADVDALIDLAEALNIDHVIPGCNDRAYLSCAQARAMTNHARFGGVDELEQTLALLDKRRFRACSLELGLTTPQTHSVDEAARGGPVIVKPVDAFSGQGITVLPKPTMPLLQSALRKAEACSASGGALVEDWVDGQLYSHSAFLKDRRIIQAHVVIEHCVANPYAVDTSHLACNALPLEAVQVLENELQALADQLALSDGLLHTQFMWDGQRCWLIELTRRCPGDLFSQLIELSVGKGYVVQYLAPFLGGPLTLLPGQTQTNLILRHTLTVPEPCTFHHLRFHVPFQVERWVPIATTGDSLAPAPKGRIAILFASARDRDELMALSQLARSRTLFSVNA